MRACTECAAVLFLLSYVCSISACITCVLRSDFGHVCVYLLKLLHVKFVSCLVDTVLQTFCFVFACIVCIYTLFLHLFIWCIVPYIWLGSCAIEILLKFCFTLFYL